MNHREVEHDIVVAAPAAALYRLIADVSAWPRIFPPTICVDVLSRTETSERLRIWASANGEPKSWTSRRVLDPDALRIEFRQEVSTPPVASMSGTWIIEALSGNKSRVCLLHDYTAVDEAGLAWIDAAVDRNSLAELDALKTNVELAHGPEPLAFSFEDTVLVDGPAKDVYDFINEANLWSARLPHVAAVHLAEPTPGLQTLEMETRAADGSVHTTKSYRVTFPHHRIVYKQVTLPALLTVHTGCWTVAEQDDGVAVTSQHSVLLNPATITSILGAGATAADAATYVRNALSTNSRATLAHARQYAEAAR
jgi:aromatase